tara:strand:+ start:393 stop:992 length:600 start_codon:yes stop_codon:yes gene_type:complete
MFQSNKEIETFNLAKTYLIFYRQHSNKHFSLKGVKKGRWWSSFSEVIEKFSERKEWDPYVFIWSAFEAFEAYGNIFPTQLSTDVVWENFLDLRHRFTNSKKSETLLAKNLLSTYKEVKRWSLENGFKKADFGAFFEDKSNSLKIKRGNYNLSLFTVSKSFHEKLKDTLTEEEFDTSRALIFSNKKILHKLKKVMGDEFV